MADPEGRPESNADVARKALLQGIFQGLQKKIKGREIPPFPPPEESMLAPFTKPFTPPYLGPQRNTTPTNPDAERKLYTTPPKPAPPAVAITPFGPKDTTPPKYTDPSFAAIELLNDPKYNKLFKEIEGDLLLEDAATLVTLDTRSPISALGVIRFGAPTALDLLQRLALNSELDYRLRLGQVVFDPRSGRYFLPPIDPTAIGIGAGASIPGAFGSPNYGKPITFEPVIGAPNVGQSPGAQPALPPVMFPPTPPGDTIGPTVPGPGKIVKPGDPLDNRGNKPRVPGIIDDLFKANPPDP